MNEYKITYSTQQGNAQGVIIERSEAAARKALKAQVKGAEITDCQRRCDFVVFRRTSNVEKWRVNVYSL